MTLDCNNINLKEGSKGEQVKELQTILTNKKYYTGKIDGVYGSYTVNAVKSYQKANNLLQDGIVGSVTCKKLKTNDGSSSKNTTGIYVSKNHWIGTGCNKLGQCNKYNCSPHSIHQCNSKKNLDKYTELNIASYAGTTSKGTSHQGIETALAKLAKLFGIQIKVTWKNFSDLGSNRKERWTRLGELIERQNIGVIVHNLYRNQYGHYEVIKQINTNNNTCIVLNSLGNKCTSTAYCGYQETRSFSTFESYMSGISQKSLCIIEYIV